MGCTTSQPLVVTKWEQLALLFGSCLAKPLPIHRDGVRGTWVGWSAQRVAVELLATGAESDSRGHLRLTCDGYQTLRFRAGDFDDWCLFSLALSQWLIERTPEEEVAVVLPWNTEEERIAAQAWFARHLGDMRRAAGLSLSGLSGKCGATVEDLREYEAGVKLMRAKTMEKMQAALGKPIASQVAAALTILRKQQEKVA